MLVPQTKLNTPLTQRLAPYASDGSPPETRPIVSKPGRYCPVHVLPSFERYAIDVCSPGVSGQGEVSGVVTSWHKSFVISSFAPAINTPVVGSRVIAGSFC